MDAGRCDCCNELWEKHIKGFPCEMRSAEWFRGFEAAHELMPCGHSRGDLRNPNYVLGSNEAMQWSCVGCEMLQNRR